MKREIVRASPGDVARAVREYERVHWGDRGPRPGARPLGAPNPFHAPLVEMGELVSVVYLTKKRGDGLSEYEHEFAEDGGERPVLAFSRAGLFIVGGSYRVTVHGIEG